MSCYRIITEHCEKSKTQHIRDPYKKIGIEKKKGDEKETLKKTGEEI